MLRKKQKASFCHGQLAQITCLNDLNGPRYSTTVIAANLQNKEQGLRKQQVVKMADTVILASRTHHQASHGAHDQSLTYLCSAEIQCHPHTITKVAFGLERLALRCH